MLLHLGHLPVDSNGTGRVKNCASLKKSARTKYFRLFLHFGNLAPVKKIGGYAASVVLFGADDHYIGQIVFTEANIDNLAHSIAIDVDAKIIEQMRRDAQPSSSH